MKDIIIQLGKFIYGRGWSAGTGGNLSARLSNHQFAMTASGRHKGELSAEDILTVDLAGNPIGTQQKPSAEALLHLAIYELDPAAQFVLHTHSVAATVLSMQTKANHLEFAGYEMLKAISTIDTHETQLNLNIFENAQDMTVLAALLKNHWQTARHHFAFLVRGHGLYVWGHSEDQARRHLEAWEFLLACELERRKIK